MLNLEWVHREDDGWLHLERVNLEDVDASGVFMIWHGGTDPQVIRVGQGDIALRIGSLKKDPQILSFKEEGELYVTWANVSASKRDGVLSYLIENWKPRISKANPMVFPVTVNSPFE